MFHCAIGYSLLLASVSVVSKMTTQRSITLSDVSDAEFAEIAEWKGLPVARLLSQYLEVIHQSDEFARLLERARNAELTLTQENQPLKQGKTSTQKN
jgi:hypothetical protein